MKELVIERFKRSVKERRAWYELLERNPDKTIKKCWLETWAVYEEYRELLTSAGYTEKDIADIEMSV